MTAATFAASHSATAAEFIQNGTFTTNGGTGQLTVNTSLANWTGGGKEGLFGSPTTPPVFVFTGSTLATGVNGDAFMGNVRFYGGAALVPPLGASSYVIAADGDPDWLGSLRQTVNGLTIGDSYHLTFDWAGAQQQGFAGPTTEKWQVSFGSSTQSTSVVSTPSQGFTSWQSASMDFTATSTSQLLSFLAVGTPGGQPPWALISNVSMTNVPEPGTMGFLSVAGLVFAGWRRHRRSAV